MKDVNNKAKNNFVPEYFLWLEPEEQKRRANELNKMTKKDKHKKEKREN